jgi:hypothetical protein
MDVSISKICLDTSILAKSIMGRKEYKFYKAKEGGKHFIYLLF